MKIKLLKVGFISSILPFAVGKATYISQGSINYKNNTVDLETSIHSSEILVSENALNDLLISLINEGRFQIAEEEEYLAVSPCSIFNPQ